MVDNPTPAVEVTQSPVRIALEDVTPTIAAAFGDDLCLIWSGEWQKYWRDLGQGYTSSASEAGRFTIAGAYACTKHCDPTKQIAFERVSTPSRGGEVEKLREAVRPLAFEGVTIPRGIDREAFWFTDAVTGRSITVGQVLDARAALASPPPVDADTPAASEGAVPAGFVLVPETLTDEMAKAGARGRQNSAISSFRDGWKFALSVRPQALAASPKPASDIGTRIEAGERLTEEQARRLLAQAFEDAGVRGYARHIISGRCDWFWTKPAIAAILATATGGVRDHAGSVREAVEIAVSLRVQAGCLESYAENEGYTAKPVPSVFHLQASHFRDLANRLSALHPVDSRAQGGEAA